MATRNSTGSVRQAQELTAGNCASIKGLRSRGENSKGTVGGDQDGFVVLCRFATAQLRAFREQKVGRMCGRIPLRNGCRFELLTPEVDGGCVTGLGCDETASGKGMTEEPLLPSIDTSHSLPPQTPRYHREAGDGGHRIRLCTPCTPVHDGA